MADEALRLNAVVVDQFTKPLQNLKSQLAGVSQAPALASMRKDWGNITKEITGGARALQSSFLPALSGINVASLGASGAITGMVAAMKSMSEGAVQAGVFRRSVDITGEKFKEMKRLGELFGQSSEQTMSGLRGLHSTIDQLKNRYGPAFQELQRLDLGKQALALKGAKTLSEALDMAMAIIRAEPNKERQADIAIALGYPGLEIHARETNEKILAEVRKMGRQVTGLSEQAALEFNLNMMRLSSTSENLTKRALAPLIPVFNKILKRVTPLAETVFTQLAVDIEKTFTGLSGISDLWTKGDYAGIFRMIDRATSLDVAKGPDRGKQIETLEKRLDELKGRRGQPGSAGDVFEEKTIKKQLEDLRSRRDMSAPEWDEAKKKIAEHEKRLEEIKELRTPPFAAGMQSDLEKEEIKLREEIKKLRESIEKGATIQQQGLQGGGGGLIQPASLGGGGGGGGGLGAGRYSLGGGGGDGGVGIGPALGGTDPSLSGQKGIGPALGATDPIAPGGSYQAGLRGPGPTTESGRQNVNSWMNFMMKPVDQGGLGFTRAQAAGNVASLMGESGANLQGAGRTWNDPSGSGQPGTSGGVASWRAERLRGLQAFARSKGLDWRSHEAQQGWYRQEMLHGDQQRAYRAIRAARTAQQALDAHVRIFEAPARPGPAIAQRRGYLGRLMGGQGVPSDDAPSGARVPSVPGAGGGGGGFDGSPHRAHDRLGAEQLRRNIDAINWYRRVLNADDPQRVGRGGSGYRPDPRFPSSQHRRGRALDLRAHTKAEADRVMAEQRQRFGAMGGVEGRDYSLLDEVRRPSGHASAPHVHLSLSPSGISLLERARRGEHVPRGALLRAGAAGEGPPSLQAKGTVNIDLHDGMKDKGAKQQKMDSMFRKVNINRGRSMPMPDAPPI